MRTVSLLSGGVEGGRSFSAQCLLSVDSWDPVDTLQSKHRRFSCILG